MKLLHGHGAPVRLVSLVQHSRRGRGLAAAVRFHFCHGLVFVSCGTAVVGPLYAMWITGPPPPKTDRAGPAGLHSLCCIKNPDLGYLGCRRSRGLMIGLHLCSAMARGIVPIAVRLTCRVPTTGCGLIHMYSEFYALQAIALGPCQVSHLAPHSSCATTPCASWPQACHRFL